MGLQGDPTEPSGDARLTKTTMMHNFERCGEMSDQEWSLGEFDPSSVLGPADDTPFDNPLKVLLHKLLPLFVRFVPEFPNFITAE